MTLRRLMQLPVEDKAYQRAALCVTAKLARQMTLWVDAVEKVTNCSGANFAVVKNLTDDRRIEWPQSRYRGRQRVYCQGNEVPHIFTRYSRVQPKEILIMSAERLFQQHRSNASHRHARDGRRMSASSPIASIY
jgi:hypothetical protein